MAVHDRIRLTEPSFIIFMNSDSVKEALSLYGNPESEDARLLFLRQAADRAPAEPGCYLWKNAAGEVIYAGKADVLRNRIKSYLNPDSPKTTLLMQNAVSLEWITVPSSGEALILEANLIKKYKPKYNVRLKDDKRYPYLVLTLSEKYPQLYITRNLKPDDGNRYFGPYTDVRSARRILDFIHKVFPIRKVRQTLPLKKPRRPCMNFFIHRCLGPCQGTADEAEYRRITDEIILFLEGRREILEDMILRRMEEYSEKTEFEKAAVYRDLLLSLRKVTEEQSILSPGGGDRDILALAHQEDHGQIVIFEIRQGKLLDRKSLPLSGLAGSSPETLYEDVFSSFIRDYYMNASFVPSKITVPVKLKESQPVQKYLSEKWNRNVTIGSESGSEIQSLFKLASKNADLLLKERLLAVKVRDSNEALEDLKKKLKLPGIPEIIECYDISHLSGTDTVASGIMFRGGEPHKAGYRRYKIKTVEGINDPASMKEVIERRLARLIKEKKQFPDLIVIDGGPTQLGAAKEAAESLGAGHIPMVGLAKRLEEIYIPGKKESLLFDKHSPGMRLLIRARDEAHRFGVTFQRSLRKKTALR